MLSTDQLRILLLVVLALPLLAAVVVFAAGRRPGLARNLSLGFALLHVVLTALLVVPTARLLANRPAGPAPGAERFQVFAPEVVPGDPGVERADSSGAVQRVDAHRTAWDLLPLGSTNGGGNVGAVQFFVGLDGLNLWLVALASVMMVPVILFSWDCTPRADGAPDNPNRFYAWMFVMQLGVLGVFVAFDIILFYVFFELTLVPGFFLIGTWGTGPTRREAARRFFLYTLAGSLITLLGMIAAVLVCFHQTGRLTFAIPELAEYVRQQLVIEDPAKRAFWLNTEYYLFLALAVGFAVKTPLVPLHSWLPPAYSQAPTGVTVLLSALLAKLGTYGLLRLCLPLAPDATLTVGLPLLGTLGAVGIIYGSLCAYSSPDFKHLIAYSSIAHLGFLVLALMAFNAEAIAGASLHMVNHGLATGALFLLVGMLMARYGSPWMADYSGVWARLPVLTFFMFVICLANVGLPGLNNFVSEMLMLGGLYDLRNPTARSLTFAVIAAFGILLSAWYLLTLMQRVFFGPLREPVTAATVPPKDLNGRELAAITPLAVICLLLGCFPQPVLNTMKRDVDRMAQVAEEARARNGGTPQSPFRATQER